MKKFLALALAAGASLIALSPAEASGGCGPGFHRAHHGRCIANYRRGHAVVATRLIIGSFYTGRGYWDGRRYWRHRYGTRGHWRYR